MSKVNFGTIDNLLIRGQHEKAIRVAKNGKAPEKLKKGLIEYFLRTGNKDLYKKAAKKLKIGLTKKEEAEARREDLFWGEGL